MLTLQEAGRHVDVLAELKVIAKLPRGDFDQRNPGFAGVLNRELRFADMVRELEAEANCQIALACLTQAGPSVPAGDCIARWRQALACTPDRGRRDALVQEVQKLVIARAEQLEKDETADRLERLNNACELLESLHYSDLYVPTGEDPVMHALADAYLNRAAHLANAFDDHETARNDARRAWTIVPYYLRSLTGLAATCLLLAKDKQYAGRSDLARVLLDEARQCLAQAETNYPGHSEIAQWKENADKLSVALEQGRPLDALAKSLDTLPGGASGVSTATFADALLVESRKEYRAAIDLYKSLLAQQPDDAQLMIRLSICHRANIVSLLEREAPKEEVVAAARQAFADCPGSELLSDMQELAKVEV